ncbi:hypothetical protein [Bacteroides sp. 519]|uniref:hypothetical protein n=1 Tax=Bacteroides sp. 519 TaxID=2302937 RepID=UPI0013D2D0C4|nr:hypothetical protein [Bacteroides sp. 519]NDV57620.1 hypothetical protein [Bacteroides sp. 519]
MELSFEYYSWLRSLNAEPFVLIFISIFGSFFFLLIFGLLRYLLKKIGLRFIADWKLLDDFMICFGVTGFFGGFLIMLLTPLVLSEDDGMGGLRLILIWLTLFACVFTFYMTNKVVLKKWSDEVLVIQKPEIKTKKKSQRMKKKKK